MADPLPHLTIALSDRYRIERGLGAGGMATVAEDLKHDRQVAVKVWFDRVDVATGRRIPLLTIEAPSDIPVFSIFSISLADNPRVYAYTAFSYTSNLFAVEGVR